jgi:glycosyltransferase involved in cell wall biosynthesis
VSKNVLVRRETVEIRCLSEVLAQFQSERKFENLSELFIDLVVNISVLIPAYNAADTIAESLTSVLNQTVTPAQIIVLLDGGTDDTRDVLAPFVDKLTLVEQENQGVACARNRLVERATEALLAFLDSDDIWHPRYLETQLSAFQNRPEAVAAFTGHTRFTGEWRQEWPDTPDDLSRTQIIHQIDFFTRYNTTTAVFGSMSYCCVPRTAFESIGAQPFSTDLHAVEDSYLCYRLALLGPVAFNPVVVVAYRLTEDSISVNRVRNQGLWVQAFERLESAYRNSGSLTLFNRFQFFYASKRREFAKVLLGVGDVRSARLQLKRSLSNCHNPDSLLKSFGLLMLSYLPTAMQPRWPAPRRQTST